jgi:hypothetical protein
MQRRGGRDWGRFVIGPRRCGGSEAAQVWCGPHRASARGGPGGLKPACQCRDRPGRRGGDRRRAIPRQRPHRPGRSVTTHAATDTRHLHFPGDSFIDAGGRANTRPHVSEPPWAALRVRGPAAWPAHADGHTALPIGPDALECPSTSDVRHWAISTTILICCSAVSSA